jgi:AraC-like DNA-binding protein
VLSVTGSTAALKFELRDSDFSGSEFILEGATGIALRFLQWLCGDDWRPLEVHLSRRAPADPRPFRRFFGAPVRFSSTDDAVVLSADWLDRQVPREERRREASRVQIIAAPFSELVRRQAAMRLGLAPLGAGEIARDLGISRRQLFRRLQAEGTTVQTLIDEFRFTRARHLLAAGDASLSQIAFALGFPEQSSFSRAFARWSGVAPGEWRRANVPGPPS